MICLVLFDLTCRIALPLEVLALRWRGKRLPTAVGLYGWHARSSGMAAIQRRARRRSSGAPSVAKQRKLRQREDKTTPARPGGTEQPEWFLGIVIRYLTFEYIGVRSERRELKHLSTCRKGHQPRLRK